MKIVFMGFWTALIIIAGGGCGNTLERLNSEAVSGDVDKQVELGMAYFNGGKAVIDYHKAAEWFEKALPADNPAAMYFYGRLIEKGQGGMSPDPVAARKLYEKAYAKLSGLKSSEDKYSYVLGLLYLYGRRAVRDEQKALELFIAADRKNYLPATIELGKMYYQGAGVKQNIDQAKRYFFKAADRGYPEAQYYLSAILRSTQHDPRAERFLSKAAAGAYPPAMYEEAESIEKNNHGLDEKSRNLYLAAAQSDYPKAQFKVYQILRDEQPEVAESWLYKAIERSYHPAMSELAANLSSVPESNRCGALILFELVNKSGNPAVSTHLDIIDRKCGMYLPVKFVWNNQYYGSDFIAGDAGIKRIIEGYRVGIIDGSMTVFKNSLKEQSNDLYMSMAWYKMFENKMPLNWIAMIFKAVYEDKHDSPGFWLNYGICAIQAGQSEAVMYSAARMEGISKQLLRPEDALLYRDLTALMKATGLIMLGRSDEAYDYLYLNGKLTNAANSRLINCINFWFCPVIKDKNKFSLATGIAEKVLLNYQTYPRVLFYDFEYEKEIIERVVVQEPVINVQPMGVL
ncbi:MAG: sel1 repeat family protein [Lentisphaerae bacterium]|nr:sel1 repeat family protein [Lentisphaerota bacterium]